ncbi:hypothetical protein LMG7141_00798 [Ralstonia condita]|uniref:Uncharacterized protein n=1 Tax=Ralstonia condita TaxID=3058600 RepID=A0ABM9J0W5_9RALS|nr:MULTISPECIES: hypothetical protein [Ralstonia]CAJ0778778.1 hypothetical protein LMG7141_00798 [Ralstonia sp. LMG 7141]CAJ0803000.1 hypothetical protein LMG18090_04373 [Ralstonia mannitolilytica]
MGVFATGGVEQAQTVVTGTLAAAANGNAAFFLGNFNVAVWGTFVGTLTLQNSYDGGTTWIPVINKRTGNVITFTAPGALQEDEVEAGVQYRLAMTAYTSGTANYRLSEGAQAGRVERLS